MKTLQITPPPAPEGWEIVDIRPRIPDEWVIDGLSGPVRATKANSNDHYPYYILRRIRTDTERLEATVNNGWVFRNHPRAGEWYVWSIFKQIRVTGYHDDFRAAIDEAIDKEQT